MRLLIRSCSITSAQVTNNASFNCNAGKVLVVSKDWPQRDKFVDAIRTLFGSLGPRVSYYPGAQGWLLCHSL